jgi:DNA-binding PadR family transcriptional regulator
MTCGYAASSPWLWLEREASLPDWVAKMTSRHGYRAKHTFGTWAMWGGPEWGPMWFGGRGPKARRGDVRAAILAVLAESAMNGYQIIQQIAERSGGLWKPSPGSIYPTLQQLEDEGLVRADTDGGRRTYTLTDEGRTYVAEHAEEVAAPWAAMNDAAGNGGGEDIRPLIGQIATAMWQIASVGTSEQQRLAREALADLRRRLHLILAEHETRE